MDSTIPPSATMRLPASLQNHAAALLTIHAHEVLDFSPRGAAIKHGSITAGRMMLHRSKDWEDDGIAHPQAFLAIYESLDL